METLYVIPGWFWKFHVAFQALFLIVTALIAFYSFRISRLSGNKKSRVFGWSFTFLSLSYLFLLIINSLFLSVMSGNLRGVGFEGVADIKNISVLLYIIFFLLGFVTLFYATLKAKSKRAYVLLLILPVVALYFSQQKALILYVIASLFLISIAYAYILDYYERKNTNTLLIAIGLISLFISRVFPIFGGYFFLPQNIYVMSNLIELLGYSFIALSLVKIIKDGKKKK